MQYRKKPVIIEAFQLPPDDDETRQLPPKWFIDGIRNETILPWPNGSVQIKTLEGTMTASIGDWIIKGVKDEIYPCKPDIFEATYEKVN